MPTGATGQLGLALPVQGELSGTWGDTVNNGLTQYTNIAIAGTLSFAGDGAITLANTTGDATASNIGSTTAQYMVIRVTGTLTTPKIITAPSYSKLYLVDNAATGSTVTFKASGQTGVSVAVGESAFVYYNGTDYIKVASDLITALTGTLGVANGGTGLTTLTANNVILGNGTSTPSFVAPGTNGNVLTSNGTTWASTAPAAGTTFSAGTTGFTPSTATSGAVTLAGTLAVANGGTGQTTYTNGQLLIGNTTGNTLTKATLTQGTGVTITNGNGAITIAATGTGGTVTSVGGTGTVNGLSLSGTVTTSGNLTLGGTLSGVANSALTNSSVTVTAGTGMSGGGAVALGSSVTLTNAGVTSIVAGTGISISGATGAVTVTNSGGAPGMVLLATVNATVSTTLSSPSSFSATYNNYLVVLNGIEAASGSPRLHMRIAVGGSIISTSNYLRVFGSSSVDGSSMQGTGNYVEVSQDVNSLNIGRTLSGSFYVLNANSTTAEKPFYGQTVYYNGTDNTYQSVRSAGIFNTIASVLSGVAFHWQGGQNFRAVGNMKIYGILA